MKIKLTKSFQNRLLNQIEYIAKNNPLNARKFQEEIISHIRDIPLRLKSFRKSIYFNDDSIRELIFKGYTIVFRIKHDYIEVFGFIKYQKSLED